MKKGFTPLEILRPNKSFLTGFTLLELLVVIIIVGILAGLALPNYLAAQRQSYASEAWANLNYFLKGARLYYANHDAVWPTQTQVENGLLPIENPNSMGKKRFVYTIATDGATVKLLALPQSAAKTGATEYALWCWNCNSSTETLSRYQGTGCLAGAGEAACPIVGG